MTTPRWMITTLLALSAPLGLLACDGGDEGDAGDEAAETGDESTGGETEEEGDETLGRTDADSIGEGLDVDADGSMDFGEAGTDTDEPTGCAANLTEDECNNAMGCASVFGTPILDDGEGGWCSAPEDEFIGCVSSGSLCPPLTKTLCDGDQMWTTQSCAPENLMVCESPGDISDICA
jgi:hypothetical protein